MINRLHNCKNPHQGDAKKVLCVCSAGLLRSPTAAWVLSNPPYNFNTRAVGIDEGHALIPMDAVHFTWADEIVVMGPDQKQQVEQKFGTGKPLVVLGIPDSYARMDPQLIKAIKGSYQADPEFLEVEHL